MSSSIQTIPAETPAGSPPEALRPASRAVLVVTVTAWALGCLGLLLILVGSGQVGPVGLWLKYNYLTAPALLAGVSWLLWRSGGAGGAAMLTVFLLTVALAILFGSWQAGESNFFFLGGLLPFSDARGYYEDALRLLHGWRFSDFSSRRPLFAALLAVLLALTGGSLSLTLIVLTAIPILAVSLAVREVQRHLGTAAGLLMLLCLFMFYRRYVGATLTEQAGLAWGCLAFCALWRAAALDRPRAVAAGLFLLALGLNARAGAFLVIPAVALWAGLRFRGPRRRGWKVAGAGLAAALLGFAANALLLQVVGTPAAAYSNLSYVLYGLVHGGDWSLVLRQHPELAPLGELERTTRIYALVWEGVRAQPLALAAGALRAWGAFLSGTSGAWYSFAYYVSPEWALGPRAARPDEWQLLGALRDLWIHVNAAGQRLWALGLQAAALAGILVLRRTRGAETASLVAAGWLGILLSVPFAPPWDADNMRAYAATLPFQAALPALGTGLLRRGPRGEEERSGGLPAGPPAGAVAFALVLLVLQLLGPLGVVALGRGAAPGAPASQADYGDGRYGAVVEVQPDAAVHLLDPAAAGSAARPGNSVNLQEFKARTLLRSYPDLWHMWRGLSNLGPNTTLALAFDLRHGGLLYLEGRTADFPTTRDAAGFCGEVVRHRWIQWVRIERWAAC